MNNGIRLALVLLAGFTAASMFASVINEMLGKNASMLFLGLVFIAIALAIAGYE